MNFKKRADTSFTEIILSKLVISAVLGRFLFMSPATLKTHLWHSTCTKPQRIKRSQGSGLTNFFFSYWYSKIKKVLEKKNVFKSQVNFSLHHFSSLQTLAGWKREIGIFTWYLQTLFTLVIFKLGPKYF